jgi:hypothetical protein
MSTLAVAAEMDSRGHRRAFRERGDNSDADPWRMTPPQKVTGSSSRKRPASEPLYDADRHGVNVRRRWRVRRARTLRPPGPYPLRERRRRLANGGCERGVAASPLGTSMQMPLFEGAEEGLMTRIGIILGSTRPNRNGEQVPSGCWTSPRGATTRSSSSSTCSTARYRISTSRRRPPWARKRTTTPSSGRRRSPRSTGSSW